MADKVILSSATRTNRNVVLVIMGLLLSLLITVDFVILAQQYKKFESSARDHLAEELDQAASFCIEPLLKNDFVMVQSFLENWAKSRNSIISLTASAPNGFNLVDYNPDKISRKIISENRSVYFQQKNLLFLSVSEDVSAYYDNFTENVLSIVLLSLILVVLFTLILWLTLRRTAIKPLEIEISERKNTEQELLAKSKELEFSNRELETYSYSIAHDLRTPLRSIVSLSQLLKDDAAQKLDNTEKDLLERIVNSGKFMSSLIDDILSLSRISRRKLKKERINLTDVVKKLLKSCDDFGARSDDMIILEENVFIQGDETLVSELMLNLLSNAHKYSGRTRNRKIEFGVDYMQLNKPCFVKDNGIGINMDYSDKLFKSFQRLHSWHDIPGSGVGLAICKRIVDRHGGAIWIESQENIGTTVYFKL